MSERKKANKLFTNLPTGPFNLPDLPDQSTVIIRSVGSR